MSFEPNSLCPVLAAARAVRLHKRIAAGDALVARLAPGILEYCASVETKGIAGTLGRGSKAPVCGAVDRAHPQEPMATQGSVADVAAAGGAGLGQNARRSRVGA